MSSAAQPIPRRGAVRRALIVAAALWVVAVAAVAVTTCAVLTAWRGAHPSVQPLGPGLAALSDRQLAELLPARGDFPSSWTVKDGRHAYQWNTFGSLRFHEEFDDCIGIMVTGSTGVFTSAEVSGGAPAGSSTSYDHKDIDVKLGREFNPVGFDTLVRHVYQCLNPSSARTVRIFEDSRPAGGPQRFRYAVTTTSGHITHTDYYSYARVSALIFSGSATDGHQPLLDTLFEDTLRRIRQR